MTAYLLLPIGYQEDVYADAPICALIEIAPSLRWLQVAFGEIAHLGELGLRQAEFDFEPRWLKHSDALEKLLGNDDNATLDETELPAGLEDFTGHLSSLLLDPTGQFCLKVWNDQDAYFETYTYSVTDLEQHTHDR